MQTGLSSKNLFSAWRSVNGDVSRALLGLGGPGCGPFNGVMPRGCKWRWPPAEPPPPSASAPQPAPAQPPASEHGGAVPGAAAPSEEDLLSKEETALRHARDRLRSAASDDPQLRHALQSATRGSPLLPSLPLSPLPSSPPLPPSPPSPAPPPLSRSEPGEVVTDCLFAYSGHGGVPYPLLTLGDADKEVLELDAFHAIMRIDEERAGLALCESLQELCWRQAVPQPATEPGPSAGSTAAAATASSSAADAAAPAPEPERQADVAAIEAYIEPQTDDRHSKLTRLRFEPRSRKLSPLPWQLAAATIRRPPSYFRRLDVVTATPRVAMPPSCPLPLPPPLSYPLLSPTLPLPLEPEHAFGIPSGSASGAPLAPPPLPTLPPPNLARIAQLASRPNRGAWQNQNLHAAFLRSQRTWTSDPLTVFKAAFELGWDDELAAVGIDVAVKREECGLPSQ